MSFLEFALFNCSILRVEELFDRTLALLSIRGDSGVQEGNFKHNFVIIYAKIRCASRLICYFLYC